MRMPRKAEWTLLALLPAAMYFAFASGGESEDIALPADKVTHVRGEAANGTNGTPVAQSLDLTNLRRKAVSSEPGNAFESKSWYVPPPPPPVPPPAPVAVPPPSAPPLPFSFLGMYQDASTPVVFLIRGDRVLTVRAGEVIEGTYRVDGIVGSNLGLTYLPLNIRQNLFIGDAG